MVGHYAQDEFAILESLSMRRRDFLVTAASVGAAAVTSERLLGARRVPDLPIVDTHQHLWDLEKFRLKWLTGAPDVLRQSYTTKEYLAATEGLNVVQAVYMEVDVVPEQQVLEAEHVLEISKQPKQPTVAAVISGRPASDKFKEYLDRFRGNDPIKGIRQVLHSGDTPPGYCLREEFVRGIRVLGERHLSFDLCMRPAELNDGVKLVNLCPDTRFVIDHCGNVDVKLFRKNASTRESSGHTPESWKRDMAALAKRKNTICKISGIVAQASEDWSSDDLAPVVNFCLNEFGPDRVVFGSDWPVCLLRASLKQWVVALREIVADRPAAEQAKLWSENASRFYKLS